MKLTISNSKTVDVRKAIAPAITLTKAYVTKDGKLLFEASDIPTIDGNAVAINYKMKDGAVVLKDGEPIETGTVRLMVRMSDMLIPVLAIDETTGKVTTANLRYRGANAVSTLKVDAGLLTARK